MVSATPDDDGVDMDGRWNKRGGGKFAHLAVRGRFDAHKYLGSAAKFAVANFGGEYGRSHSAVTTSH